VHVDGVFAGDDILDGAAADFARGLVGLGGVRHGDGIDGISICRVSVVAGVQTGIVKVRRQNLEVASVRAKSLYQLDQIRLAQAGVGDNAVHVTVTAARFQVDLTSIINQSLPLPPPHSRYTILLRHTHPFYAP
jgi:hypothetical protein